MGHKDKASTNYSGGDSPKRLYLSPSTRTISPGIKVLPYAIAIVGVAFLVSAITASIVTPVQNSDAIGTEVLIDNTPVSYYVNIATNSGGASTISRDVYSTIAGTLGVITDTLHINSNTPNGYFVYLSAANGHNQYLTNEDPEYSSYHINPISGNGTVDNTQPVSLTNPGNLGTANTWGVAVADTYNAVFDAASAYASDSVITQTTKFAPVPAYGSEERLITRTGDTRNSGAGTIDTIPVYYGFHTNSSLPAGTYSDTVLYTAYAEATDQASGVATATYVTGPNGVGELSYKTGGVLTLTTSLYTDRTLSTSDATVTLTNNTTNESNNCPITSIGQVQKGTNDSIRIVCTAPIQSKPGTYTVHISIPGYAHNSIASVEYKTDGITIAEGKTTPAGTYTTMQALKTNPRLCTDWADTPDRYDSGASAPIYAYGADGSITEAMVAADLSGNWTTAVAGNAKMTNIKGDIASDGVPETYLQDNRDGNYYRVRKLADGYCWMTENLRLAWGEGDTVETQNGTWTPHNTTETARKVGNYWKGTIWGEDTDEAIEAAITAQGISSNHEANFRASYYDHSIVNPNTQTTPDGEMLEIGVYYNWNAATAGTGTWVNTNATDSICPKGWQLPVLSGNKSWNRLTVEQYGNNDVTFGDRRIRPDGQTYGITGASATIKDYHTYALTGALRAAPFNLSPSGSFSYNNDGIVNYVGSSGFWWTSVVSSNVNARNINFGRGYFYSQGDNGKGNGYPVRCVSQ